MLTLFHHPMSSASRYIRLLLSEYGVATQLIVEYEWQKRYKFRTVNLAGTIPVLLEGKTPICGASVICEYLDETRGAYKTQSYFFPPNPLGRAEVRRLCEWFLIKLENEIIRHLVRERIYKQEMPKSQGGGAPDSSILRTALSNIQPHMQYLNWLAANRDWLGGSSLSYADFAASATVSILDYMGEIEWTSYPMAHDWYARLKSRPSFRSILADRIRVMAPIAHYADLDF
ncbi:MAG: glutathione S-transferase [Candidatus Tokpelaia sp. JSC188]|nr:MAG: glutathione S-transferase [Candidatus Tokpelaia sp. JSC188]